MIKDFSVNPSVKVPRSMFRRNHNLKTTMGCDYLYPVYVDEALPGDTFICDASFFGRLTTPLVPIMDNIYLDVFFFAVPIRLVDDNFRKIMGERPFGDTTTEYLTPVLRSSSNGGFSLGSLSDYLGLPIGVPGLEVCAYWHRAYNLIWNEFFRDENLVTPAPIAGVSYDGTTHTETIDDYVLRKRGKRHDYFTSCLPWPQKGDPVTIPVADEATITSDGYAMVFRSSSNNVDRSVLFGGMGATYSSPYLAGVQKTTTIGKAMGVHPTATPAASSSGAYLGALAYDSGLTIGGINSATVNQLREAFALQSLLEVDARGGTRLIEIIRAHFGVISPDARMQRPEYLGGLSQRMNVTTVPQTSASGATGTDTPQGNLSAYVTVGDTCHWVKSFTEHCVLLGLANVRADLSYQQGIPRMFSRRTRYDFYWPELANLGEQAVLNKEIFAMGNSEDDDVFGYQERWAEYRYHPNMITGVFRSSAPTSLDYWHLAQDFSTRPTLNADFIEENVPIDRVVAVSDEPPFILDAHYSLKCARPMPLYSIPSLGRRL